MKQIALSSKKYPNKFALVDDEDYEWLNQYKWFTNLDGHTFYARASIKGEDGVFKKHNMHRMILGITKSDVTLGDHEDRNGLNNQRYNLRKATHKQNNTNKRSQVKSTSIYLGVSFEISRKKWRSSIRIGKGKKPVFLGRYNNEIESARAYNEAAIKYHGEFANLNIFEDGR